MKTKLLNLFFIFSFIIITASSYAEVSNGFNFRVWDVEWDANSNYLNIEDDYLYSLGYSSGIDSWTTNLIYSWGTFDGSNMYFYGDGSSDFTPVERGRKEYECSILKSFQAGSASIGVGAGYRYMNFDVDFDNFDIQKDITIHGPALALSYSQGLAADGAFILSASGTVMPYLFETVELNGPWYIGSYYAPHGAEEDSYTWGWNAQVAGSYALNRWIFTLGYKYQTIKEKEMDLILFDEETFSGFFVEAKVNI